MSFRTTIAAVRSRALWTLLSLAILALVWFLVAAILQSRYLPAPMDVSVAFMDAWRDGELTRNILITLARVAASFVLAMVLGSAIGIFLGRNRNSDKLFDGWLILALNLPALVTIILCYIWFGLNEVAAIAAVAINKIPNVAVTLREGARALNNDYQQMADIYKIGRWRTFRHVVLPQLNPYFAAAARSGLALVWKIVLVVELLGRSNGVGFQLHLYFQLFDVAGILAYTFGFVFIVQAIELLMLQPWERRANRWRQ